MSDSQVPPDASGAAAPKGPTRRRRTFSILILLALLGLPFAVSMQLQNMGRGPVPIASQPGGPLSGSLTMPDGQPAADVEVMVFILTQVPAREPAVKTSTAADGTWSLDVPAANDSAYLLRMGGGKWQWSSQAVVFVDPDGVPLVLEPIHHQLEEGCTMVLQVTRKDGKPPGPATVFASGIFGGGGFLDPFQRKLAREQEFDDASEIRMDGFPPMEGKARVVLDSGITIVVTLSLVVGENVLSYQL
jgi:hypothetical protein